MEDYQTSTVDGAEGFERMRQSQFPDESEEYPEDDRYPDYEADDYSNEDWQKECNCSDPGCPCRGNKTGRL